MFSKKRDYKSALCLIPPQNVSIDAIQAIREKHDKGFVRWMPHVNYSFPFVPHEEFPQAVERLKVLLKDVKPFRVRLKTFETFVHRKSATMWLKPETIFDDDSAEGEQVDSLQLLYQQIQKEFSFCEDGRNDDGFIPHLSVGQFKPSRVKSFQEQFQSNWECMEFEITEIHLISRADVDDPFHIRFSVPLGGDDQD